jgi:hypothetical protein
MAACNGQRRTRMDEKESLQFEQEIDSDKDRSRSGGETSWLTRFLETTKKNYVFNS